MKYILTVWMLLTMTSFCTQDDLYSLFIGSMSGPSIPLQQFEGKKIIFLVLPTSEEENLHLAEDIREIQSNYKTSVVIIGVPPQDLGIKQADEGWLTSIYANLSPGFLLAKRMGVKKGTSQSEVFKWLTSKERNRHFNRDIKNAGTKLIVDEAGDLFAVVGAEVKLSDPFMNKILGRTRTNR